MGQPNDAGERLALTIFPDTFAKSQRVAIGRLEDWAKGIAETSARDKDHLPYLKAALFSGIPNPATGSGCLRYDEGVTTLTGWEIDVDDARGVDQGAAVERVQRAGIACLLYGTSSSTPDRPRYRVIGAVSQSVRGDWQRLRQIRVQWVARVNGVLGGIAADESFKLSQSYFFGRVGETPLRVDVVPGRAVDLLAELDAGAIGLPIREREPRAAPAGLSEVDLGDAPTELREAAGHIIMAHRRYRPTDGGKDKYALANRLLDLRHYGVIFSADAVVDLLRWYDPGCDDDHATAKVEHAIKFRDEPRGCEPATDYERYDQTAEF